LRKTRKKREVGWLSAACLMTRREALEAAGFFDEFFFLYFEDIDLCYRLREKGWKLVFLPEAKALHIGGTSTASNRSFSRYHYRRSQIYFYRKHNSRISIFLLRLYLRLVFILMSLVKTRGEEEGEIGIDRFFRLLKRDAG
jgi:GT2 family glycosyltransferase